MNIPRTEREFYSLIANLWKGQASIRGELLAKSLEHLKEEQRKGQEAQGEIENLDARMQDLELEKERDKALVPLDRFCRNCNEPWKHWDGKRYLCWQCGEL